MAPPPLCAAPPAPSPGLQPVQTSGTTGTAHDLARSNWLANVRALSLTQSDVVDAAREPTAGGLTWAFARDGSLTAFDEAGRWWAGCSVPLGAARAMLKTLDPQGRVACFLGPTLAAHLTVALEMLRPDQGMVAVVPEVRTLRVLLRCADFSAAVTDGRLWFAWGGQWADELARVFNDNPGLATPSQFIRLPVTAAEDVERLVSAAQKVFAATNAARAATVARLREVWRPRHSVGRFCVVAPSQFRLWDDGGHVLGDVMQSGAASPGAAEVVRFDPDLLGRSSLLSMADAAATCDAVVSADLARADLPGAVPESMPWLTWVTTPRVPPAAGAGLRDAVMLADPAWGGAAAAAGWSARQIHVAAWPAPAEPSVPPASGGRLAVVADTSPLDPPERLAEFSSHLLLWERLRADVLRDPFLVGSDADEFLGRVMRQFGVSDAGLDRRLFVDRLIVPAYQQGLARILLREKLPVRLFGAGWERVEDLRSAAAGPVRSRRELRQLARETTAFVHAWPCDHAHPVDALGRPVVRVRDSAGRSFVADAMRALAGRGAVVPASVPEVSLLLVLRVLEGLRP